MSNTKKNKQLPQTHIGGKWYCILGGNVCSVKSKYNLKIKFLKVFILVLMVEIIAYNFSNGIQYFDYFRLQINGAVSQGTILCSKVKQLNVYLGRSGTAKGAEEYLVKYKFVDSLGNQVEPQKMFIVSSEDYSKLNTNESFKVIYLKDNSSVNAPYTLFINYWKKILNSMLIAIVGGIAFSFIIVCLMYAGFKKQK